MIYLLSILATLAFLLGLFMIMYTGSHDRYAWAASAAVSVAVLGVAVAVVLAFRDQQFFVGTGLVMVDAVFGRSAISVLKLAFWQ